MSTRADANQQGLLADGTFGVSPYTHEEAWAIASRLSPRDTIRVAARDSSGEILNQYDRLWDLDGPAPTTTWAMLLADDDLRFRYLCFDFDNSNGPAARDADRLSYWLDELNVPHLVCISGPSGGRHIWVRLEAPADAAAVKELAHYARSILTSLDVQPLTNPASGCVRPPFAPHRAGGYSNPLGNIGLLIDREAGEHTIEQLTALLVDLGAELPPTETTLPHGAILDGAGNPRIRGPKRPLSAAMDAALHGPAGADASHTLARILIAAANSRWSYDDIVGAAATATGLEHARTRRVGNDRVRRSPASTEKVLRSAWHYAVRFVASHPLNATGDDPDYRTRVMSVTTTVQRALERADSLPGLWATRNGRVEGTRSQRAVLDALCLYMLQSGRPVVEADVRRLSADTGYGRTTVSVALTALARDWIEKVAEAEGVHANKYRLHSRFSTEISDLNRTQARMRAEPAASLPLQQTLAQEIGIRLGLLNHDVFTAPRSLGRARGLLYMHIPESGSAGVSDLSMQLGVSTSSVRRRLARLVSSGLIERAGGGWRRIALSARDFVARSLNVDGHLARRARLYELERARWAWWQAEVTWMERRSKRRRGRRPSHFTESDRPGYVAYPRGPSRRCDHRAAMELVRAGILDGGFAQVA